jgi:hypothetical protein
MSSLVSDDGDSAVVTHGRLENAYRIESVNLNESDKLGNLDVDNRTVLK